MADTPDALIAGQRIALSVMREAIDAERARSDARLVALARIDGWRIARAELSRNCRRIFV